MLQNLFYQKFKVYVELEKVKKGNRFDCTLEKFTSNQTLKTVKIDQSGLLELKKKKGKIKI